MITSERVSFQGHGTEPDINTILEKSKYFDALAAELDRIGIRTDTMTLDDIASMLQQLTVAGVSGVFAEQLQAMQDAQESFKKAYKAMLDDMKATHTEMKKVVTRAFTASAVVRAAAQEEQSVLIDSIVPIITEIVLAKAKGQLKMIGAVIPDISSGSSYGQQYYVVNNGI